MKSASDQYISIFRGNKIKIIAKDAGPPGNEECDPRNALVPTPAMPQLRDFDQCSIAGPLP